MCFRTHRASSTMVRNVLQNRRLAVVHPPYPHFDILSMYRRRFALFPGCFTLFTHSLSRAFSPVCPVMYTACWTSSFVGPVNTTPTPRIGFEMYFTDRPHRGYGSVGTLRDPPLRYVNTPGTLQNTALEGSIFNRFVVGGVLTLSKRSPPAYI